MYKINAKEMLLGNYLSSFWACFRSIFLSFVSLLGIGLAIIFSINESLIVFISGYTGRDIAPYVLLTVAVLAICFFTYFYARGKFMLNLWVWKKSGGKAFPTLKVSRSLLVFRLLISNIMKSLFSLAWGFAFLAPFCISTGSLFYKIVKTGLAKNIYISWGIGSGVLLLLGLFFTFIVLQRYSAWYYLLTDTNMGIVRSMQKSIELTEGKCVKVAFFKLSLLPWLLLCLLILPAVYIIPYYKLSVGVLIRSFETQISEPIKHGKAIVFKRLNAGI